MKQCAVLVINTDARESIIRATLRGRVPGWFSRRVAGRRGHPRVRSGNRAPPSDAGSFHARATPPRKTAFRPAGAHRRHPRADISRSGVQGLVAGSTTWWVSRGMPGCSSHGSSGSCVRAPNTGAFYPTSNAGRRDGVLTGQAVQAARVRRSISPIRASGRNGLVRISEQPAPSSASASCFRVDPVTTSTLIPAVADRRADAGTGRRRSAHLSERNP